MSRQSTGQRNRFEILKRDGFRCRYCGANAVSKQLHVDHVVPVAEGGTDDPANLVAACADCNLGKSSVPLGESRLEAQKPTEAMLEHADQMRAYLDAVEAHQRARDALSQAVVNRWCLRLGSTGMPNPVYLQLGCWIERIGLDGVLSAVDVVAAVSHVDGDLARRKYFVGVMRNKWEEAKNSTSPVAPLSLADGHTGPVEILTRDNWQCRCCGVSGAVAALMVGSVFEPQFGGDNDEHENLVTRCAGCAHFAFHRMPLPSEVLQLRSSALALLSTAIDEEKRFRLTVQARHLHQLADSMLGAA